MAASKQPSDPLLDLLHNIEVEQDKKRGEHEKIRSTAQYQEAIRHLDVSLHNFLNTLKVCMFAATRHAFLTDNSFFLRMLDEFGASAISASFSIRDGLINSARRELRFMLELAVQTLFVDQNVGNQTFDKRLIFFERHSKIRNSSVDNVRDLSLVMLNDRQSDFCKYVAQAWAEATKYVHPTPQQIVANLSLRDKGVAVGFETVEQVNECFDEVFRTEAIVLELLFHAIGPSFTGDLLVDCLDNRDDWPFHSNIFIASIDEYFDYKHERQTALSNIRERRARRLAD